METFPEKLKGRKYYEPGNLGLEKDIQKRIDWWNAIKARIGKEKKEQESRVEKKEKEEKGVNQDKKSKK
jgi:replication-associated recombination protein RarA